MIKLIRKFTQTFKPAQNDELPTSQVTNTYIPAAPKAKDITSDSQKKLTYEEAVALNIRQNANSYVRKGHGIAMDANETIAQDNNDISKITHTNTTQIPNAMVQWFGSQGFIGYQNCAILSQNAFIDRACGVPIDDCLRKGYTVSFTNKEELGDDFQDKIKVADKKYKIDKNLREFGYFSRVFGIRIALFMVETDDPHAYYEKPFNIDGVKKGTYKGISQIDPYWITPQLDSESASDPVNINFYEPTWWRIGSLLVHRSHLVITRYSEVADILKPTYQYGGVSLPQQIFERVWAAERIANEAPALVLSKRSTFVGIELAQASSDPAEFEARAKVMSDYWSNYGIRFIDREDTTQQYDTNLTDVDTSIMTQFQLVAAIAKIPAVKLMGTTPKGFNATGEYEEANYHESLESIQSHTLEPLLERHYQLLFKSEFEQLSNLSFQIVWNPLDTTTYKGKAENNLLKLQADHLAAQIGSIGPEEVRNRLINDPESGYEGLERWDESKIKQTLLDYGEVLSEAVSYRKN